MISEEVKTAAADKALTLGQELKTKVHPVIFNDPDGGEPVVGFLKEPNRMVKLAIMDKQLSGAYSASAEMLDLILIKEHSDSRLWSEDPANDTFYIGAVNAAYNLIKVSINQASELKKNI